MATDLICPTCQQADQIQKVSGLYKANTKEWVENDQQYDHNGELVNYSEFHRAQTLLGKQLAPPQEPSPPASPKLTLGIWGFILFLIVSAVCLPFSLLLIIPLAFLAFGLDQTGLSSEVNEILANLPPWTDAAAIVLLCLVGLVILGFLVWLVRFARRKYEQGMQNYQKKKAEYDRELLPGWQWAMQRWENMYYCARDETVFVPGEGAGAPVAKAQTFINRGMQP